MSDLPSLLEMLKAGVHFGHQKSRWHPKMEKYIFGARNSVHIIDLEKTLAELEKALQYVKNLSAEGKVILFVGTKRQAREHVKAAAETCGAPYLVERWIGGLLTNFDEVRRRLRKYHTMQNEVASGEVEKYTKKEQTKIKKDLEKMDRYLRGLSGLEKIPDAIYLSDLRVEKTAAAEAERKGVPMVAICDTNVNPTKVDYPIPANDDAVNAIKMMANLVAAAVTEGKKEFEMRKAAAPIEAPKKEAPKVERRAIRKEQSL